MRGTVYVISDFPAHDRITPAHAGNSDRSQAGEAYMRDHPRTCGEQAVFLEPLECMLGSPPHMRGTEEDGSYKIIAHRITPAHAGNREL